MSHINFTVDEYWCVNLMQLIKLW